MISILIKLALIYYVFRFGISIITRLFKSTSVNPKKGKNVKRYDSENNQIKDADYEEVSE